MRLFSRLIVLLFATSTLTRAEEHPWVEIFSGFSYARANFAGAGQRNNFYGWEVSLTTNVNRWLGVEYDFAGHSSSANAQLPTLTGACPPFCVTSFSVNTTTHEFLVGPRFSFRGSRTTPFAHILLGAARDTASTSLPLPISGPQINVSASQTGFAAALGGGLDLRITRNLAWHNQADYLVTRLFNHAQNNVRASTGIAFRF
jgi:opacity protein-like surface antigen